MSNFDPEALIDAVAPLLDLPVETTHRPGVILHLTAAEAAYRILAKAPLDTMEDPAPIFRPDAPE